MKKKWKKVSQESTDRPLPDPLYLAKPRTMGFEMPKPWSCDCAKCTSARPVDRHCRACGMQLTRAHRGAYCQDHGPADLGRRLPREP